MVKIDMVKHQLSFKPPDLPTAKSPGDRGGCQLSLSPSAPLYSNDGREDARYSWVSLRQFTI